MKNRRHTPIRAGACLAALSALLMLATSAGAQFSSQDCLDCHSDPDIMEGMENLIVTEDHLAGSVHEWNDCVDCHMVDDIPHAEDLGRPQCANCHDSAEEDFSHSIHGRALADGIEEAPDCGDCHGGHDITYVDDETSKVAPRNQPETCGKCHSDPELVRKFYISIANPTEAYKKSAHYHALMSEGDDRPDIDPPTCSTCHSGHSTRRASDPDSPIYNGHVVELCGQCHEATHDIYLTSVHGQARRAGNLNAPTCISCHGEHSIVSPENGLSTDEVIRLSSETCVKCHSDQSLIQRAGMSALRVTSYRESYHGLAGEGGSDGVARCASCHGTHNIYRSEDPASLVNEDNLVFTCGRCHEGATQQFASIRVHSIVTQETTTPAGMVRIIYLGLIAVVIGGMAVHNLIIYSRYVREKYRAERHLRNIQRFPKSQIIQHAVLVLAFATLAFTGFALKFPDSFWVGWLQSVGFDEALRRWTHRIAAIVLIVQSLVQGVWLIATPRGRKEIIALLPTYRDVVDFFQNMRYHLFKTDHQPRYGRFDYAEKAEYLALIWGTMVMAVTGLILWFPEMVTQFMPAWIIEVSTVVHYYEAILATVAIVVWHWFFVIYHPREFPMRLTWLTGAMTEHDYRHHHPLEYDEIRDDPDRVIPPHYNRPERNEDAGNEGTEKA